MNGCFWCRHSPNKDMNVNSKGMLTLREKSPLPEAQRMVELRRCIRQDSEHNTHPTELLWPLTSNTASGRTASPTHYPLSCCGPQQCTDVSFGVTMEIVWVYRLSARVTESGSATIIGLFRVEGKSERRSIHQCGKQNV